MPALPALSSPPTNTFGLAQYLAQRLPGYDFSEYVRELNAAYIHVWEEVSKLKNNYFTNMIQVTVAAPGAQNFDLLYNADGNLTTPLSPRLYQISRIRVLPPNSNFGTTGLWQASEILSFQHEDFLTIEAQASPLAVTFTGPYRFVLYGHGRLRSALPLAAGTIMEITYTYWPLALTYMTSNNPFGSTITSAGFTVTGTNTTFTQLVQPDFLPTNPFANNVNEEAIQAELVCNGGVPAGGQVYRIATIPSDTLLTLISPASPAFAAQPYVLSMVPEIPREHIRVIAAVALQKMFSVDGDDQRVTEWTAIAAQSMQMMKDSLIERQSNTPPKKRRFQFGVGRRNRAFLR